MKKQQDLAKSKSGSVRIFHSLNSFVCDFFVFQGGEKRLERDADIMRQKQQQAADKKAANETPAASNKVVKVDMLK